jgi:hypothetical protein
LFGFARFFAIIVEGVLVAADFFRHNSHDVITEEAEKEKVFLGGLH